jgi:uncharacterized peroxidase-related enzyme
MALIDNRAQIIEDRWSYPDADGGHAAPSHHVIPLDVLASVGSETLIDRPIGAFAASGVMADLIVPFLDKLDFVVVEFPKFRDGRVGSPSRALRESTWVQGRYPRDRECPTGSVCGARPVRVLDHCDAGRASPRAVAARRALGFQNFERRVAVAAPHPTTCGFARKCRGKIMTRLPLRTIGDAPEAAKELLVAAEKRNGFLPNLLRTLANAPVALETYLTVSGINARSSLSIAERETVQITAAATHGCGFCVAGHTLAAYKQAGLDSATVEALRNLGHVPNERLEAVARFTKVVIASRGRVEDADLEAFKACGFSDQAALEVVLGVSLATLCNFANNLGGVPLNPQFEPYRWDGVSAAAAG